MFNPVNAFLGLFSLDMAIDLGTATTLVAVKGRGILINEPSIVALEKETGKILAVGLEAKEMLGRTPGTIVAIRPIRDGVISDFDVTEAMIHYFIRKVHEKLLFRIPKPRVIVGIPSGVTEVEKKAVYDAVISAGAREVYLVEEPIAAAIGADLPVNDSVGSMVIDIGGGTTEIAVLSLGGVVQSASIRIAGDEMDEDIIRYAKQKYNLLIGERMAEQAKIAIGSAYTLPKEETFVLRGRNLITGLPDEVEVSSVEIREAISGSISAIINAARDVLDDTPPELVADLMERGIALVGGGALLKGIDRRLSEELKVKVYVADDPITCVVRGAAKILESLDVYYKVLSGLRRP